MAGQDDIIQNIALGGGQEIVAAFSSIEKAGVGMFTALAAAANASSFSKFNTIVGALTVSVSAAAAATFNWTKASAAAVDEMGDLASQTGTTIENISTLTTVFTRAGVEGVNLATTFRRLAARVETEWADIQKSVAGAGNLIIANNLAVSNSVLALERAQVTLAQSSKAAAAQQVSDSLSVKSARLAVAEIEDRLGGGARAEELTRERAVLNLREARLRQVEAIRKAEESAALAANKRATEENAVLEAQLKLAEATKKRLDDEKNSVENLTKFVNNLISGVTDASLKVEVNTANIIKGLVASAGLGTEALEGFKGGISELADAGPALTPVLLKLADLFKNSGSAALNTTLALKLFGRGVKQDLVDALSKGSEAILKEQERLKALGLTFTEVENQIATKFRTALFSLNTALGLVGDKFALTFAPEFTKVLDSITKVVEDNKDAFVGLADTIINFVVPAFNLVAGVIRVSFNVIKVALTGISALINSAFGENVTSALSVGVGLLILKFGGLAGAVLLVGIAIDKLTDGGVQRSFVFMASVLETIILRLIAVNDVLNKKISFEQLKQVFADTRNASNEAFAAIFDSSKKVTVGIVEQFKKSAAEVQTVIPGIASSFNQLQSTSTRGAEGVKRAADAASDAANSFEKLNSTIKIVTFSQAAFDKLPSASKSFGAIREQFNTILENIDRVEGETFKLNIEDIGPQLEDKINEPLQKSLNLWEQFLESRRERGRKLREEFASGSLGEDIVASFSRGIERIDSVLAPIGEAMLKPFREAGVSIVKATTDTWTTIQEIMKPTPITAEAWNQPALISLNDLVVAAQLTWDKIAAIFRQPLPLPSPTGGGGGGGGGGSGFASGGLFRGAPGRDTNLAWLTDLEYVMRPAAVKKYGVNFMNMVNGLQLPRGFSMGGLVDNMSRSFSAAAIPGFADGGLNMQAASHMTVDLRTNAGTFRMVAPQETAKSLHHYAVTQKYQRAGRSPNWRGS